MNKLSRAVTGVAMFGAAFVGQEAYRQTIVENYEDRVSECLADFDDSEATACIETANDASYVLPGLAELATVIGGISMGVVAYRTVKEQE